MSCCNKNNKSDDSKKAKVIPGRLCYCFNYSKEDFRISILENRESSLIKDIQSKMKDPGCFCETSNPSGKCCLLDIKEFIEKNKKT